MPRNSNVTGLCRIVSAVYDKAEDLRIGQLQLGNALSEHHRRRVILANHYDHTIHTLGNRLCIDDCSDRRQVNNDIIKHGAQSGKQTIQPF